MAIDRPYLAPPGEPDDLFHFLRAAFHAARFEEIAAEINRIGRARTHGGAPQRIRAPQVV